MRTLEWRKAIPSEHHFWRREDTHSLCLISLTYLGSYIKRMWYGSLKKMKNVFEKKEVWKKKKWEKWKEIKKRKDGKCEEMKKRKLLKNVEVIWKDFMSLEFLHLLHQIKPNLFGEEIVKNKTQVMESHEVGWYIWLLGTLLGHDIHGSFGH